MHSQAPKELGSYYATAKKSSQKKQVSDVTMIETFREMWYQE